MASKLAMDQEVEEVSFLPGEAILNKKALYEPTKSLRQVICSRGWAICILMAIGIFMVAIALIAAFARPSLVFSSSQCSDENSVKPLADGVVGKQKAPQTYISKNGDPFPWKNIRLPKTAVPELYNIFLHPNISESYFKGKVLMTLRIVEETDFIVFHTAELNISGIKVFEGQKSKDDPKNVQKVTSGQPLTVISQLEYPRNEQFYVKTATPLLKDMYVKLQVEFRGSLADLNKMNGLYKSQYEVNGEKRFMISTHFEATTARKAFPCLDEPQLKAKFSMGIVRDPNLITLFNTKLERSSPYESSLVLDEYEISVKMSSYLVAFVVCDFKNISKVTKGGVEVRVFAAEDKIYMGNLALDAAVKILDYYNSFFGVAYPLPKQDLIAIPNFAVGAMENWGLITYRETAILYDPKKSALFSKEWVTTVVAHELAHQWFGNLVTMKWWNDLWLNEGFATFVEHLGVDFVDKEFHNLDSYVVSQAQAMYLDSFPSSHPVEVEVTDPAEIAAAFDKISYEKGSSIIRMLRNVLGEDHFQAGLTSYLKKHSYSNAETKDLWVSLQEASKLPSDLTVSGVMDTWTKQMGYPVVTVTRNKGKLHLDQERFLLTGDSKKDKSPFGYKWMIPFTFTTSENPGKSTLVWMKKGSASADLPSGQVDWVKGNNGTFGYYRVNYDKEGWQAIIKQLTENHMVFSVADRIGIMDDVFSLARAGLIDYTVPLDLSKYLVKEKDTLVFLRALAHLYFLEGRLMTEDEYDLLQSFMLSLTQPLIDSLGWENTGPFLTRKHRPSILEFAVSAEYKPAVDKALDIFKQWQNNESVEINNNLRGLIYSTGLKQCQKSDWELVFQRYLKAKVPSEKEMLLGALGSPKDVRILKILLDYSLDKSKVRSQDSQTVLKTVTANDNGLLLGWRFFRQNYDTYFRRYGSEAFAWSQAIKSVITPFNTQFDADEIKDFFKDKDLGSGALALSQGLEVVQSHIEWTKSNMKVVKSWLKENVKKTSGPR